MVGEGDGDGVWCLVCSDGSGCGEQKASYDDCDNNCLNKVGLENGLIPP